MDTAVDDNFFIEEPQKLRNNFFNRDKSMQMVELLAPKHHDIKTVDKKNNQLNQRYLSQCRLTYSKKIQQLKHNTTSAMPKSYVAKLELLCQAVADTDDTSIAKTAVDTLICASKSGCCFLEKYIVILLNFCTRFHPIADETMRIKVEELMNRVLVVEFDRQQMTENLRKPELKLNSIGNIVLLLRRVQNMLDYREETAVNWLVVLLDAYFVDLATKDEAVEVINRLSDHINFRSALLQETENTKCLLKSIIEVDTTSNNKKSIDMCSPYSVKQLRPIRLYYTIEYVEI